MSISRRTFLKSSLSAALAGVASGALPISIRQAYAADYRAMVCVDLAGGNDGHNLLVPNDDARYLAYSSARGKLALPRESLLPMTTRRDGAAFGFHPRLRGLNDLFNNGRVAVLANVGTLLQPLTREQAKERPTLLPRQLFSHSHQQFQWFSGESGGASGKGLGWGGMIADALGAHNSVRQYPSVVSMAGSALFCQGLISPSATVQPGGPKGILAFGGVSEVSISRRLSLEQLLGLDVYSPLIRAASNGTRNAIQELDALSGALAALPPLQTPFPTSALGQQLKQVAKLIQARSALGLNRQVFYTSLGGFDTHASQLSRQANLLSQLDDAMIAFYYATQELGVSSQVLSFTISDFGRTLKPSNDGSDHGWGSHHVVMGDSVSGGDVYGEFPDLTLGGADDVDARGRLIPSTSVEQYAATIGRWMGVSGADIATMFPNLSKFGSPFLGFV